MAAGHDETDDAIDAGEEGPAPDGAPVEAHVLSSITQVDAAAWDRCAGRADPFDAGAPGLPRWRLALVRVRGGRPATCDVEWNRETGDFRMAAALADRPATPQAGAIPPRRVRAVSGG